MDFEVNKNLPIVHLHKLGGRKGGKKEGGEKRQRQGEKEREREEQRERKECQTMIVSTHHSKAFMYPHIIKHSEENVKVTEQSKRASALLSRHVPQCSTDCPACSACQE